VSLEQIYQAIALLL